MTKSMWPWILGGGAALIGLAVITEAAAGKIEKKVASGVVTGVVDAKKRAQNEAMVVGKQAANAAINTFVPGLGVFFPKGIIR